MKNAEVVVNSRTQRSKGFAFVTMGSVEEARRAVQELSSKDFMGRPLQLSGAKPNNRGEDSDAPSQEEARPGDQPQRGQPPRRQACRRGHALLDSQEVRSGRLPLHLARHLPGN